MFSAINFKIVPECSGSKYLWAGRSELILAVLMFLSKTFPIVPECSESSWLYGLAGQSYPRELIKLSVYVFNLKFQNCSGMFWQ
jgi:hypothetical protein